MIILFTWILGVAAAFDWRAEVDPTRLEADVRALSGVDAVDGPAFVSRHIDHPDHQRAGDWLVARLEAIDGLEVSERSFDAVGRTGLRNLVADLPGSDPAAPMLVIGAHWDSTGEFVNGWDSATDPAPGADDDASGVAAVLELARILAQHRWVHPIRFALFDAEEQGLNGSIALASEMKASGEGVLLMLQMDPVGYNHDGLGFLWVTYDERWSQPGLELAARAEILTPTLDTTALERSLIGGSTRSDHASFWEQGYPALHIASFPQPPTYHTPDDTMANVDIAYTTEVAVLLGDYAASLAEPVPVASEPEEKRGCGCANGGAVGWLWLPLLALATSRRAGPRRREARSCTRPRR